MRPVMSEFDAVGGSSPTREGHGCGAVEALTIWRSQSCKRSRPLVRHRAYFAGNAGHVCNSNDADQHEYSDYYTGTTLTMAGFWGESNGHQLLQSMSHASDKCCRRHHPSRQWRWLWRQRLFIFFSPIGRAFGASVSPSVFGLPTGCRLARIADIRHHPVARRRAVPFLSGYRAARLCYV
jgi:hypothetical protein